MYTLKKTGTYLLKLAFLLMMALSFTVGKGETSKSTNILPDFSKLVGSTEEQIINQFGKPLGRGTENDGIYYENIDPNVFDNVSFWFSYKGPVQKDVQYLYCTLKPQMKENDVTKYLDSIFKPIVKNQGQYCYITQDDSVVILYNPSLKRITYVKSKLVISSK